MQSVVYMIVSHALVIATVALVVLWADRWLRSFNKSTHVRLIEIERELDELRTLAHLVDSGDLDGAREVAREILEGSK